MRMASLLLDHSERYGVEQAAMLHALGTRLIHAAERIDHDNG